MTKPDEVRSQIMRAVRSKDTRPELSIRHILHNLGYRYRLHSKDLPGSPDLVFSRRRKVVFVHGCFWHGHDCKRGAREPKTNAEYWKTKITNNKARDTRSLDALQQAGWEALIVWECELKAMNHAALIPYLVNFLGPAKYK